MIINITMLIAFMMKIMNKVDTYLKERANQKALEMNLNYNINENDFRILDMIVENSFNSYMFQNMEKMDTNYVNSKLQNEMVTGVLKLALLSISPLLRSKLSYIYNSDYIDALLLQKVQLMVVEHCSNLNSSLKEEKN